jgi:hypothetical protein
VRQRWSVDYERGSLRRLLMLSSPQEEEQRSSSDGDRCNTTNDTARDGARI